MPSIFAHLQNTTLMPLEGNLERFTSGVFDAEGHFVEGSMLDRCSHPAELTQPKKYLTGTYLFGGCLFGHYGHFILESLSRAYAFKQCSVPFPIVFMTTRKKIDARTQNIFSLLGIRNQILLITESTQVENLLFSKPGCGLIPHFITPEQVAALGTIPIAPCKERRKIWLSRSYLSLLGGITNEQEIEDEIVKLGYEIIHPERMAFLEQVRLVASSAVVAGFDGSAFYTALFAKKVHGHFCLFSRRNYIPPSMLDILSAKRISIESHVLPVEHVSGAGARERFHMPDTTSLLDVLKTL